MSKPATLSEARFAALLALGVGAVLGAAACGEAPAPTKVPSKPVCTPSCDGRECGDDGCGGSCGSCLTGTCQGGACTDDVCVPDCSIRECGDDGCGGSCGTCAEGTCRNGECLTNECVPFCTGRECGDDGCGGSCGTCATGSCVNGACIDDTCVPSCSRRECGDDGCGGSCGTCATGTCRNGACVPDTCQPDCTGRECGADGCDGSCGTCATGTCVSGACVEEPPDDCETGTYSAYSCGIADPCGWALDGYCDDYCTTLFPTDHFDDTVDCGTSGCAQECAAGTYTACTCSAADPCGWTADGYCDDYCATQFPIDHFDDTADCGRDTCPDDCAAGNYTACSCSAADPCGWANDGYCDDYCATTFPSDHFADIADCSGVSCPDDCETGTYSACSCSAADPCGWANDDYCDDYCTTAFPADHFNDGADCVVDTCGTDCAEGNYTACSCSVADPCDWADDGYCDDYCATTFPSAHFADTADCAAGTCGTDCAEGNYTACSCSAADPCAWAHDDYCDDYCATAFPAAHFDDSSDCLL